MSRWGITAVFLVLLLLGTGGYLAYRALHSVMGNVTTMKLGGEVFDADRYPPPTQELPAVEARVRKAYSTYGGWRLGLMLQDLLLLKAWRHPDESVTPLAEALQLAELIYPQAVRADDEGARFIGGKTAWGYLYAGLPGRMDTWGQSYLASFPSEHESITLMRIDAAVMRDDIAAARALADAEVARAGKSNSAKAMAVAACLSTNDYGRAAGLAQGLQYTASLDPYVKYSIIAWLMHEQRYSEVKAAWDELFTGKPDADDALLVTAAAAGDKGLYDAEARKLIELGATSTRIPRSVVGMEAGTAAYLYFTNCSAGYTQRILALRKEHPRDFDVVSAEMQVTLYRLNKMYYNESNMPRQAPESVPGGDGLDDLAGLIDALLGCADTASRQQRAHLEAAGALCYLAKIRGFSQATLQQAVDELRRGLGDPAVHGFADTQRLADYAGLLLDPAMQEARRINKDFDRAVNHAVIDYLNRRRDLFAKLDAGPVPAYRDAIAAPERQAAAGS